MLLCLSRVDRIRLGSGLLCWELRMWLGTDKLHIAARLDTRALARIPEQAVTLDTYTNHQPLCVCSAAPPLVIELTLSRPR